MLLTVRAGYKFSNTFIDIVLVYNIHMYIKHCQQYYNVTHFIQLSEVRVIQLCGSDPDMTKIELQQHLQISPLSLIWVNGSKRTCWNDFFCQLALAWLYNAHWVPAMHILTPLAKSTQSRDSTWAPMCHVSIASILRKILFVNDSNATIFTHVFLITWRSSELILMGLSLFFSVLIQYIQLMRT